MAENNRTNDTELLRVGFFLGCVIPTEQYAYELSLRKLMPRLGVELVDLEGFSCCGAPLRSINQNLCKYLSIRNLAICSMAGVDILAPCPICHLALTEAKNLMTSQETSEESERYKTMLAEEGLEYKREITIYHTIDILHDVIGLDKIKENIVKPLGEVEFACHYGCHTIRPTDTGRPDSAEHPEKLENLLKLLGASSRTYPERLNCCGGPLILNLPDSALTKTGQKLKAVQDRGFAGLVDVCPWGHRLLDTRQKNAADTIGEKLDVPVFYLTQLIGLALGIKPEELGLNLNLSPINRIEALNLASDKVPNAANEPTPKETNEITADTESQGSD